MQKKFSVKCKKLYFGSVIWKKRSIGVPREVMRWAMRNLGVDEWLVLPVMSMYEGA